MRQSLRVCAWRTSPRVSVPCSRCAGRIWKWRRVKCSDWSATTAQANRRYRKCCQARSFPIAGALKSTASRCTSAALARRARTTSKWSIRTCRYATPSTWQAICFWGANQCDAQEMLRGLGIRIPNTRLDVENLSGGQRQAIAISRAVSFDPKVLIMDEPTAALAVAEVEAVLELVHTVSRRGVSVILISHRLQDLFLVCDRISVMYEGQNIADRKIGETNLEEIVDLIVGRKFSARSARALA